MTLEFHDIRDARFARTRYTARVQGAVAVALQHAEICAVTGPLASGRRTAVRHALEGQGSQVHWLPCPASYSTRDLLADLHRLVIGSPDELTQRQIQDDLLDTLNCGPRTVVISNAERLTLEASGQLHWLHDRRQTTWSLLMVGTPDFAGVLHRHAHLREGIATTTAIRALTPDELLPALRQLHTIFNTTPEGLLLAIDSAACHGLLGRWVRFLRAAVEQLDTDPSTDSPGLNRDRANAALATIAEHHRHKPKR